MNKHIELVKKWLDDPESVSPEERKANAASARIPRAAAYAAAYWVERYKELTK